MINNWEESRDILTIEDLKEMVGIQYPINLANNDEKTLTFDAIMYLNIYFGNVKGRN